MREQNDERGVMVMKTVMITGADGFLGARLAGYYKERFHIIRVGHGDLDITDESQVMDFVGTHCPDVVLHCAAISNTGTCEQNPELSQAVNLEGTVHMGKACKQAGSKMVFMSSDQVYAGSPHLRPNREDEDVFPVNIYGMHKKQAEEQVMAILPKAVCLRLPWMYDFPVRGMKCSSNLLCAILKSLVQNQPMKAAVYDYRGITYVQEVVKNMEAAMELPGGVYNFGSPGTTSAYDAARALLSLMAEGRDELVEADTERFKEHPRNLSMSTEKIGEHGILFPDTIGGFERCFEDNPQYVQALFD